MLTKVYHRHLTTCLSKTEYLILSILLNLLQTIKQVKLETLAASFPLPILFESRRKKLQRFLESQFLTIEALWLPIISKWIQTEFKSKEVISIVIDRTQWATINILMVSLVFNNRAIPLYFELIDHVGNSDLQYQQSILSRVLSFLKQYTVIVLGDREFCSVELARWLTLQGNVYFCLRLKKNTYIQVEKDNWTTLNKLGLRPGMSFYYQGVKVTKTKGFQPVNIVGKWKRKYQGVTAKEGWFILTNFEKLEQAISAYKRRMGIEEMFRDFKMGGYKVESSKLSGHREHLTYVMSINTHGCYKRENFYSIFR